MANVLKKITIGNPLANFEMWDELEEYERIETDEELADFYHKLLIVAPHRPLLLSFVWAMIAYSTGVNVNTELLIE